MRPRRLKKKDKPIYPYTRGNPSEALNAIWPGKSPRAVYTEAELKTIGRNRVRNKIARKSRRKNGKY